jgi:hypothetical protein
MSDGHTLDTLRQDSISSLRSVLWPQAAENTPDNKDEERRLSDWYKSGVRSALAALEGSEEVEFEVVASALEDKMDVLSGLEDEVVSAARYLYAVKP